MASNAKPRANVLRDLTNAQKQALLTAAGFLLSGEWDETITATEKIALERAVEKLRRSREPAR